MAKTYNQNKSITAIATLILLALVITAAISLHQTRALSLPIPQATSIATLLLPIITGLTLQGTSSLANRSPTKRISPTWLTITVFTALTIYETVVITLSFTHMVPPSTLTCGLDQQWRRMYSHKDADGIKRIQDVHDCCGLHSTKDMAWPLPAKGRPATACETTFGRDRSCFGSWRRDEQVAGGLLVVVGLVTFLVKISLLLLTRPRTPWTQYRPFPPRDEPDPSNQRRQIEAQYHDEDPSDIEADANGSKPSRAITGGNGDGDAEGPAMQPSAYQGEPRERNEWA